MKRDSRDAKFSLEIRTRDNFTCQRCGASHLPNSKGLHCAHNFSRARQETRFDPDNAVALCYGCHQYIDGHPVVKEAFFRKRLGDALYEEVEQRSLRLRKREPVEREQTA